MYLPVRLLRSISKSATSIMLVCILPSRIISQHSNLNQIKPNQTILFSLYFHTPPTMSERPTLHTSKTRERIQRGPVIEAVDLVSSVQDRKKHPSKPVSNTGGVLSNLLQLYNADNGSQGKLAQKGDGDVSDAASTKSFRSNKMKRGWSNRRRSSVGKLDTEKLLASMQDSTSNKQAKLTIAQNVARSFLSFFATVLYITQTRYCEQIYWLATASCWSWRKRSWCTARQVIVSKVNYQPVPRPLVFELNSFISPLSWLLVLVILKWVFLSPASCAALKDGRDD